MRRGLLISLAVVACARAIGVAGSVAANVAQYEGQKVVQILGTDTQGLSQQLEDSVTQVLQKAYAKGGVTALVTDEQITALKAEGFDINVIINDFAQHVTDIESDDAVAVQLRAANETNGTDTDAYFQKYHDYMAVNAYLDQLAATVFAEGVNSTWLVKKQIGKTEEKRPIWAFEVGNPDAKQAFYVQGGIHAAEWAGTYGAQYTLTQWVKKLASGNDTALFEKFMFIFVPMLNVDGYRWAYLEDRLWRKNRGINSNASCPGVDLNRNYNGFNGWKLGDDECSRNYGGPEAYSEAETKTMVKYLNGVKSKHQVLAMLDMHTAAEYIVYPYGYDYDLDPAPNLKQLVECGDAMEIAMNAVDNQTYTAFNAADWYPASGAADDYWYDKVASGPWADNKGIVFTVEMRPNKQNAVKDVLPVAQLPLACKEAYAGFQAVVDYVLANI